MIIIRIIIHFYCKDEYDPLDNDKIMIIIRIIIHFYCKDEYDPLDNDFICMRSTYFIANINIGSMSY